MFCGQGRWDALLSITQEEVPEDSRFAKSRRRWALTTDVPDPDARTDRLGTNEDNARGGANESGTDGDVNEGGTDDCSANRDLSKRADGRGIADGGGGDERSVIESGLDEGGCVRAEGTKGNADERKADDRGADEGGSSGDNAGERDVDETAVGGLAIDTAVDDALDRSSADTAGLDRRADDEAAGEANKERFSKFISLCDGSSVCTKPLRSIVDVNAANLFDIMNIGWIIECGAPIAERRRCSRRTLLNTMSAPDSFIAARPCAGDAPTNRPMAVSFAVGIPCRDRYSSI